MNSIAVTASCKDNPNGWNVNGERAYMMHRGVGHPADHCPCKVAFAYAREKFTAYNGGLRFVLAYVFIQACPIGTP